jgi:TetR/AcrR family transcriptional repressor of nem operon
MGSREKVLETAADIFGKNGYQATSVDDILERAGVSPSNFYYHFKSKEALASEVLAGYVNFARREFSPIWTDPRLSPPEKMEQMHKVFVQKMLANRCCGGCPLGNLAQELSDSFPEFRKRLAEFFVECMEGIAEVVRQGIKSGSFRKDMDPQAAAYLLFGSIEGLMLLSKNLRSVEPLEKGFRQALELLKT